MPLVNYDANGNILRHSLKSNTDTDHLRYFYKSGKPNTLDYVADGGVVASIGAQTAGNYTYDEIGNLIHDASESTALGWDVYNKLRIVTGGPSGTIAYTYDAQGNRMYKAYDDYTDVYVRDAGGNIIAIYKSGEVSGYATDSLREFHLYGSSRLGLHHINKVAATTAPGGPDLLRPRGYRRHKSYELTNHLGNVLTTISDLKQGSDDDLDGIADIYHPHLASWADYYPFGMEMAGRTGVSGNTSRFGFNGKEKDPSISDLTHYDYGFRVYNPAVGRFLSVDPLKDSFPDWSPFCIAYNNPLRFNDSDGRSPDDIIVGGVKWTPGATGIGHSEFVIQTFAALNLLIQDRNAGFVSTRERSGHVILDFVGDNAIGDVEILQGPHFGYPHITDEDGKRIHFSNNVGLFLQANNSESGKSGILSPATILGHEFGHAWLAQGSPVLNDHFERVDGSPSNLTSELDSEHKWLTPLVQSFAKAHNEVIPLFLKNAAGSDSESKSKSGLFPDKDYFIETMGSTSNQKKD